MSLFLDWKPNKENYIKVKISCPGFGSCHVYSKIVKSAAVASALGMPSPSTLAHLSCTNVYVMGRYVMQALYAVYHPYFITGILSSTLCSQQRVGVGWSGQCLWLALCHRTR